MTRFGVMKHLKQLLPERLWEALTDPDMRAEYSFGSRINSDWTQGSAYEASGPDGTGVWIEGENVEVEPPRRLVQTMRRCGART